MVQEKRWSSVKENNQEISFEFEEDKGKKLKKVDESINVDSSSEHKDKPYKHTIEELQKLIWESSPLAKVELVYNTLKYTLAEEVDIFWEGYDQFNSANARNIDIDNL